MTVRYITVTPITKLFKPATRAFGDIAIVGAAQNDDIKLTATEVATLTQGVTDVDTLKKKLKSTYPDSEDVDAYFTTNNISDVAGFQTKGAAAATAFISNRKAKGPTKPIPITNPDSLSPNVKTTLLVDVTATDTTVSVASIAGFPSPPFNLRIDKEIIQVTAINGANFTVKRGVSTTTSSDHKSGALVIFPSADKPVEDTDWFKGDLGNAVRKAFVQNPGPTTVWAVRTANNNVDDALTEVAKLDVQIVTIANTPLTSGTSATIVKLSDHVVGVSKNGSDGKERIGIAMLKNGDDAGAITGNISNERMIMVAHKSTEDAAAAVAGTIAGYEPHISLLLKPVNISMDSLFSDSEIDAFNTARVNWLTDLTLIPGKGIFMGEGYTLGADIPYIDIIRTIDDISFRLKAELIRSIGDLRVSRSGLRALVSQMTAILEPLKQREVIEGYDVFFPLLFLLDKDPASLTDAELQQINSAQNARTVDAIVSVDYAGAIHRLNFTLKFV